MSETRPSRLSDVLRATPASAMAAVSIGGALGAVARHALTLALPSEPTAFNLAIFTANAAGGLLIGVLMVVVTDIAPDARLLRPFLGVGVLGGFTTFSAYIVDIGRAVDAGATLLAIAYAFLTMAVALLAAATGMRSARRLLVRRPRRPEDRP